MQQLPAQRATRWRQASVARLCVGRGTAMSPAPASGSDQRASQTLALRLGGFALDVQGSTSHETDDTWDATWLAATARCEAPQAAVSVPRVVLTSWSVRRFCDGLEELVRTGTGCALLAAEGPELAVCASETRGRSNVALRVEISAACATQGHWFVYHLDPADLQAGIAQCEAILAEFPAREVGE